MPNPAKPDTETTRSDIMEMFRDLANPRSKAVRLQLLLAQLDESQLTLKAACNHVSSTTLAGMTMTEMAKIFRAKQQYDEARE